MQWMAFQDPDKCQEATPAYTIFLKGLTGIHGTRGVKTTGRRQKR
jgi:hypothetical protein